MCYKLTTNYLATKLIECLFIGSPTCILGALINRFATVKGLLTAVFTHPSWLYDASTIEGEEYAFEVTQVQCTENIIKIINTATITIDLMFAPNPSLFVWKIFAD